MLTIKPLSLEDVDHLMGWVNDHEVVGRFISFTRHFSREDELAYVKKVSTSENDRVFSLMEQGNYVGQLGLHEIDWRRHSARLALFIVKKYWGRGYAQQAMQCAVAYAFGTLQLHKLWLMVWEENEKGKPIYEKCGFKPEGVLRDEYFHNGCYHNIVRMSLLETYIGADMKVDMGEDTKGDFHACACNAGCGCLY